MLCKRPPPSLTSYFFLPRHLLPLPSHCFSFFLFTSADFNGTPSPPLHVHMRIAATSTPSPCPIAFLLFSLHRPDTPHPTYAVPGASCFPLPFSQADRCACASRSQVPRPSSSTAPMRRIAEYSAEQQAVPPSSTGRQSAPHARRLLGQARSEVDELGTLAGGVGWRRETRRPLQASGGPHPRRRTRLGRITNALGPQTAVVSPSAGRARRSSRLETNLRCHNMEPHATCQSAASPLRLLDKKSDSRGADTVRLNASRRASCEGAREAAAAIARA